MSNFTLEWFKSKKGKKFANLLIDQQSLINDIIKEDLEKPYRKIKLVNDVFTIVLKNGEVLSKPSFTIEDFNEVRMAKSEKDIFVILKKYEFSKELIDDLALKVINSNFHLLKELEDFEISESSVKLVGTNRTIPKILVNKFIEVVSKWKNSPSEELQSACNSDDEYVSLKRFFMWCCLNPRAEVSDSLYEFLENNSFRITKQGFFVALRNVVTIHGSTDFVKFVSESYTKIKAVWKKKPDDYHVILKNDGSYKFTHVNDMTKVETVSCIDCDGTCFLNNDDESLVDCSDGVYTYSSKNYKGKDLGTLTNLYVDLPNRDENRFTDDWTKTFDIRIGKVVSMPIEDCNWSTQDCAAAGLKCVAS